MKNKHTLPLAALLITLSTTTMHSMELQKHSSDAFVETRIARDAFKKYLTSCTKQSTYLDKTMMNALSYAYDDHTFLLKIYNLHCYRDEPVKHYYHFNDYSYFYSSIGAIIVTPKATIAEKQQLIKKLLHCNIVAQPADRSLAKLEFYERMCELKNKLYSLIAAAADKDTNNIFAPLPVELIQCIFHLMTDTEKPLL
jgi:hypothetical protein